MAPEDYDIISKNRKITPKERRNLIIVAKTLQSIANESTFDDKEDYMNIFASHSFLAITKCQSIFDKITTGPIDLSITMKIDKENTRAVRQATKKLNKIIKINSDNLLKLGENQPQLENDVKELISICTINSKASLVSASNDELKNSWDKIERRRESFKNSMAVIENINAEIIKAQQITNENRVNLTNAGSYSPRRSIFKSKKKIKETT